MEDHCIRIKPEPEFLQKPVEKNVFGKMFRSLIKIFRTFRRFVRTKRRFFENRNRIRNFCFHLFVFLLPLAVEVAASAASTELRHPHHFRHGRHSRHLHDVHRHRRFSVPEVSQNMSQWPVKRVAEIPGDIVIGGLHMIHEREDAIICGPVMPQGGLQAWMMNHTRMSLLCLLTSEKVGTN